MIQIYYVPLVGRNTSLCPNTHLGDNRKNSSTLQFRCLGDLVLFDKKCYLKMLLTKFDRNLACSIYSNNLLQKSSLAHLVSLDNPTSKNRKSIRIKEICVKKKESKKFFW